MAAASGANVFLSYVRETTRGVTPGTPTMKTLRTTGRNINRAKGQLRSAERRKDRQRAGFRHGGHSVSGSLPYQLSMKDQDDIIEMAMSSTFAHLTTPAGLTLEVLAGPNRFRRSVGSWILQGFHVGMEVVSIGFTAPGDNTTRRVLAVTATDLTVDGAALTAEAAAAGSRQVASVGRVCLLGSSLQTMTVERGFDDINTFEDFWGTAVNNLSVNLTPEAIVGGTIDLLGLDSTGKIGTSLGDPLPPTENEPFDSFTGELFEGGVSIGLVTGLSFNVNNNRTLSPTLFRKASPDVFEGVAEIGGTMTIHFEDPTIPAKFDDETISNIEVRMDDLNGTDFHRITVPRVKYTGNPIDPPQSGPVIISMPWEAEPDSITGTSLIYQISNLT